MRLRTSQAEVVVVRAPEDQPVQRQERDELGAQGGVELGRRELGGALLDAPRHGEAVRARLEVAEELQRVVPLETAADVALLPVVERERVRRRQRVERRDEP